MNHSFVILLLQVQWWGYHEVVGTLKPYHMLKNLFELIAASPSAHPRTTW